jgi:ABC-2 type transport system ATP-binding protein
VEHTIRVENLSKSYDKQQVVVNFNLAIAKGEVFGLLGANGAGKSTSIECMLGTKKPDSGTVSILDMNPYTERRKLFERVGVQFQETNFQDKIKVGELCEVTAALYQKSLDYRELLSQFGLAGKEKNYVSELSGGQKQRLFIVLALIPDPEVVFLDELTTGLDPKARRDVWKSLNALKAKGITILLTSHFMDEVAVLCDRIMILKQGQTIFCGTVAEAIAASPHSNLEEAYLWFTEEETNASI